MQFNLYSCHGQNCVRFYLLCPQKVKKSRGGKKNCSSRETRFFSEMKFGLDLPQNTFFPKKNIKNHIPRVVFDLPSILGGNQRVARHLTRHLSGTIFWRPPAASNLTTRLRLLTWPFELAKLLTFHFSHFKGHFWAFPSGSKCRHRPISVILPVCNSAHGSMAHFTPPATILAPAPCL